MAGNFSKAPRQIMAKRAGGSPYGASSTYCEEIGDKICSFLIEGFSLRHISELEGMPSIVTILNWLSKHEEFYVKYYTARQLQMENYVHEMIEISDDETNDRTEKGDSNMAKIARDRLKIDTRKWIAAKLASKIYGDKVQVDAGTGSRATLVILDNNATPEPKLVEDSKLIEGVTR